ncbi:hypothetical protein COV18_06475 [Candidatus Woesearchaeota archaeon CG10_big_fil_rev_8_21_14_0_10_37_12]|nr:MAG: hypothetical protein COV18_06475 [Candidatus Woesearchaeota archaeon CG10_big_fil_rev_8_21_14_0_10_37_12]
MKFFLIRHGETTGDVEDRYGGDYDDLLTLKGKRQSKELATKLRVKDIELIFHSPKSRAMQTAKILSGELHAQMKSVLDIRERNYYAQLSGMTKSEAQEKYPELVAELKREKIRPNIPDAEDYDSFKKRVLHAIDHIAENTDSTVAIVCHGGPISCFLREVIGKESKKIEDCAFLEVQYREGIYSLKTVDGVEFE